MTKHAHFDCAYAARCEHADCIPHRQSCPDLTPEQVAKGYMSAPLDLDGYIHAVKHERLTLEAAEDCVVCKTPMPVGERVLEFKGRRRGGTR